MISHEYLYPIPVRRRGEWFLRPVVVHKWELSVTTIFIPQQADLYPNHIMNDMKMWFSYDSGICQGFEV